MYDFNKKIDRRGTNSLKWDIKENELPMWVADMDFEVCPKIVRSLEERLQNHIYGYNIIPDEWYFAYIDWWKKRHNFEISKDWLMFSTGVVPSISSIVRRLTLPGEKILVQTPVYNIFFNSIYNNGRYILESPLIYKDGKYSIDFNDLEKKLSDPQTTLMILCNPHNPVGKIWDSETLEKIGNLCYKHNVIVLSDEIHCDITKPNKEYIPFQSVNEICKNNSVVCIAPTKAFNIAGLQTSAICIPNKNLFNKVYRGINNDEIAEANTFAVQAAIAAFTKGSDWLDEVRIYIDENKKIVKEYIEKNIKSLYLVESEATYLLWIDCKSIVSDANILTDFIRENTGLYLSSGEQYGISGKSFIRMNIACPKEMLLDGLDRLKKAIDEYKLR